jgi:hypothetical protein
MSNPYEPPPPDPEGPEATNPTEQFWGGHTLPAGKQGPHGPGGFDASATLGAPGPAWQPQAPGEHLKTRHRSALRWTVGIVVVALLAGTCAVGGVSLLSHSSPAGSSHPPAAAGPTGQASLLNQTLSNAGAPGGLPDNAAATPAGARPGHPCARVLRIARAARRAGRPGIARAVRRAARRCHFIRRRVFRFFLLRGVDGQFTFTTRAGTKTLAYERGVIESISPGTSLVVRAQDGTTWTWDLVSTTVVRDTSGKVSQSTLAAGQPVWVGGPVTAGAKDARLIVVRPPGAAPATSTPTPGS